MKLQMNLAMLHYKHVEEQNKDSQLKQGMISHLQSKGKNIWSRRSGSKTFSQLQEKNEQESAMFKDDLEIRKHKMKVKQRSKDQIQKVNQLINQQNEATHLIRQQQMSVAFLNFMNTFTAASYCSYFFLREDSLNPHNHHFSQNLHISNASNFARCCFPKIFCNIE